MAEKTITLHIPDALYQQVEKAAQARERWVKADWHPPVIR